MPHGKGVVVVTFSSVGTSDVKYEDRPTDS